MCKVAQVILQRVDEPKLLCRFEVKIRQDVEGQVQLLVQIAYVPFEFGSERHNAPSQPSDLRIDFL